MIKLLKALSRPSSGLRLLPLIVAGYLAAGCGQSRSADVQVPPAAGHPVASDRDIRILENPGFTVGYDVQKRRAAWVAFRLRDIGRFQSMHRPDFKPDPRLQSDQQRSNYDGSGFDRGHMAPNYAIRQLYGRRAQRATFYYSNIVAQRSRLNQLAWQRLEEIEIDDIAPVAAPLWVITGPMPAADDGRPQKFYRLWLAHDSSDHWQALAFVVPQHVRGDERLSQFRTSINTIEKATGLDFWPELSHKTQARLEADAAPASTFNFARYACKPARYREQWQDRSGIHLDFKRCDSP